MPSHDINLLILKEKITHQTLMQREQIFKTRLQQQKLWFTLKLAVGYASLIMVSVVFIGCIIIIVNHGMFPDSTITSAGYALSGGVLGLSASIWKIIVNPTKEQLSQNKK